MREQGPTNKMIASVAEKKRIRLTAVEMLSTGPAVDKDTVMRQRCNNIGFELIAFRLSLF